MKPMQIKRGSMLIARRPTAGVEFQQKIYSIRDFVIMFFDQLRVNTGKRKDKRVEGRIGNMIQGKVQVHLCLLKAKDGDGDGCDEDGDEGEDKAW